MNLTPQLTGSAPLQPTLQITVPELYPPTFTSTSTSSGQYDNPQSHDRLSSHQHSTTWSADTRNLSLSHTSLQPVSPIPQPRTTSVQPNVLYSTQPQYPRTRDRDPQNYPPQNHQQRQRQPPSPPRPQNNISSRSQPLASPNTSQGAPLYATQYNSLPSSSQYTGTPPSNYDIGRPSVAHQPPPIQNRQDASIRRSTGPGEGGGMSDEWRYHPQAGGTPSVSGAFLYMYDLYLLTSAVADSRTTDCTSTCPAAGGSQYSPASAAISASGCGSGAQAPNLSHSGL